MKNEYEVRGNVTAIFIESKAYGRYETLISTDKLSLLLDYTGTLSITKSLYVEGRLYLGNNKLKRFLLHRIITNAPDGMDVDHINHDTLNNTNENLRVITHQQNGQNRKGTNKNNTSGIRGVSWHKSKNKWEARIMIDGKNIYLGRFNELCDARETVNEARAKYMPYSPEASL